MVYEKQNTTQPSSASAYAKSIPISLFEWEAGIRLIGFQAGKIEIPCVRFHVEIFFEHIGSECFPKPGLCSPGCSDPIAIRQPVMGIRRLARFELFLREFFRLRAGPRAICACPELNGVHVNLPLQCERLAFKFRISDVP